jgi:inosose dehydratase
MLQILKAHLPRINHVHLKDVRDSIVNEVRTHKLSFLEGVKKGTFTVPGDGIIQFKPVFELLEDFGYEGWIVVEAEQDPAKANPFEYALKARRYIQEVAGI